MTGRLRIGIDGYNFAMPNGTGVASYGMTLAETLREGGHAIEGVFGIDPGNDPALVETLFFDRLGSPPMERTVEQRRRDARSRNRAALNPFLAPRAIDVPLTAKVEKAPLGGRLPRFDRIATSARLFEIAHRHFHYYGRFVRLRMATPPPIMHWTYPVPVELVGARNVYTLHDLVPLKLPYTTLDAKRSYRRLVERCVARADRICTISEQSRADILAEFPVPPERVVNCYQAATTNPLAQDAATDAATIEGVFGLKPQGYFLFFGAIEPKKNLGRLIEAYLSLATDTPLVIVGGRSWQSGPELMLLPEDDAAERAHDRRLAERIIRLHHLPRALLLRLIRSARAVLFPSLYEGFGLPILEAMQVGTPVLTSTTSAMPEVAGNAALLVDPYDPRSIAEAIRALDSDPALRAALSAAGPVQAAMFSEDRYRARLEALYASLAA